MSLISFVIPCYKSEKTIGAVVNEIRDTVNKENRDDYEIVLVNDGSGEPTWKAIEELCINDSRIKGLELAKNFGQHNALMAGLRCATGDIVVCLDDDGQTPADEVYKLIYELEKGYDVVYADYSSKKHSAFRNLGSKANGKMLELMVDKPKELYVASYFAMQRFVCDEIIRYENPYSYLMGLVLRSTKNISSVPVNHREREIGNSGYSLKKLVSLWVNGLTAFSVKPLRIATIMGFVAAFIGVIFAIYVIINKIVNPVAPLGWSSTIMLMLILGGLILSVLGIMGEYIGRIYICINASPQYVVRRKIN